MKINKVILAIGFGGLLLTGCTESHYVNPNPENMESGPDLNVYENYELDEDQLMADVLDVGLDPDNYPMAAGIDFGLQMDKGIINIAAIVKDGTSTEDALWYGSETIKVLNDQIASQDLSYELSSDTSYGGVFEKNDAHLDIYYAEQFENDEEPFFTVVIPAGVYMTFDPADVKESNAEN